MHLPARRLRKQAVEQLTSAVRSGSPGLGGKGGFPMENQIDKKMENEMETVFMWGIIRIRGFPNIGVPTIMENQMENEMETGII